jgi:hypothetical protein
LRRSKEIYERMSCLFVYSLASPSTFTRLYNTHGEIVGTRSAPSEQVVGPKSDSYWLLVCLKEHSQVRALHYFKIYFDFNDAED